MFYRALIFALVLCSASFGISPAQRQVYLGGSAYPPQANLAHWLTGTTDGSNLVDRISTTNDPVQIVQRPCVVLDGVEDYVDTGVKLGLSQNITVLGWVSASTGFDRIFSNYDVEVLWHNTHKRPYLQVDGKLTLQTAGFDTKAWGNGIHFFAAIFKDNGDGTIQLTMYLPEWEYADTGSFAGTIQESANNIYIGRRPLSYGYFEGKMAECACYKEAFTADQINSIYNTGIYPDGAYFKYHFEESSGSTVYDVSGNGNHGLLVTPNSGQETARAGRCDEASYVAQHGFTLSGSVQVPALSDGLADALGNTITNSGGQAHNGGDYSLYFPLGYGISGTNTYAELLSALDTDSLKNIYIYTDDPPAWISAVTNISIYSGGVTNIGAL